MPKVKRVRTGTSITMHIGGMEIDVIFKAIKHINISVRPPHGQVRVSAPVRVGEAGVRAAITERLDWIHTQQQRILARPLTPEYRYEQGEYHHVWGELVQLDTSRHGRSRVERDGDRLWLIAPESADVDQRKRILERWYRRELEAVIPDLIARWEPIIGCGPSKVVFRWMKTKWGTCQPRTGVIRLNTALAQYDPACLEYVVVHELVHLLEPSHNARFYALMTSFLPDWKARKARLNAHE